MSKENSNTTRPEEPVVETHVAPRHRYWRRVFGDGIRLAVVTGIGLAGGTLVASGLKTIGLQVVVPTWNWFVAKLSMLRRTKVVVAA